MSFIKSLEIGKGAEQFAENYFKKNKLDYIDVRNDKEYQNIDVDYIVNNKRWEVKKNYQNAMKGHKGWFFWIEISIDDKQGWWQFNDTDYFFFVGDNKGIILKNDNKFKSIINNMIENGNHSEYGINRYDYIKDFRYNGFVTAKCMRVYIDDIKDIEIINVIKRKYESKNM